MGCTPSQSTGVYTRSRVCRDLDTCSTFVPSHKSSVSTPERPEPCVEASGGKQTFLSVPCRDVHARTVSQSSYHESCISVDNAAPGSSFCMKPCSTTRDPHTTTDGTPQTP